MHHALDTEVTAPDVHAVLCAAAWARGVEMVGAAAGVTSMMGTVPFTRGVVGVMEVVELVCGEW